MSKLTQKESVYFDSSFSFASILVSETSFKIENFIFLKGKNIKN